MKSRSRIRNLRVGGENRLPADGMPVAKTAREILPRTDGELQFNDPTFHRNRDGLRAIISTQLGKDVPDLSLYGIFGD